MGLFDIAIKNIKRNFYNYFLYFAAMIFSIMVYFTFTSIQYNAQVQRLVDSSLQFSIVFKSAAVVIAVFVAVFIWYSNSFFIRRRKKEVALYSLLGIRKKQIGRMLFYENMVMGVIALGAGVLVGSLLSKLFIMLLIRLMGFSADIAFMVPAKAVVNTAVVFLILFLLTSIHGYRLIYRFKLIELFKADKQGDREPKASAGKSMLTVLCIGGGYWLYTKGFAIFSYFSIFITLVLTIIGTFLLFSSLTLFVIRLSRLNRRKYFQGINMIGTSQLLYRIKGNARTLATIAVLSAATLTAMEVSSSFYYSLNVNLQKNYGFTYAIAGNDKSLDQQVEAVIAKHPRNKLLASAEMNFMEVDGDWPDFSKPGANRVSHTGFFIISESNYRQIAAVRGLKDQVILLDNQDAAVFEPNKTLNVHSKDYVGQTVTITENQDRLPLKVTAYRDYSLPNSGMIGRVAVVKDEIFQKYAAAADIYRINGYITDNKKDSAALTEELANLVNGRLSDNHGRYMPFSSYYSDYKASLAISGVIIFIATFLGLLFLTATGSIIFFKLLSEAHDDQGLYEILRKIGVTGREIKSSLSKQILLVFALPLVVGTAHSLVASTLLSRIIKYDLTLPIIVAVSAFTVIYMIYYFLTVNSYCKMVMANK